MEIYQIKNYCFPFSTLDNAIYTFCVSPWLFFGTSNRYGRSSWSLFQPSASTTMCTSGRGQRCFSIMRHDHGSDHIPSPALLQFCCICSLVWHTVKLALSQQAENDTVWTGSYLPTSLYTHLILILLSVILQPTLSALVVNIEHLASENNHLGCSVHLFP